MKASLSLHPTREECPLLLVAPRSRGPTSGGVLPQERSAGAWVPLRHTEASVCLKDSLLRNTEASA